MGRPLNDRYFGPQAAGFQLLGSAVLDEVVGAEAVYIIKQRSSRKFLVAAVADPTRRGTVITVDKAELDLELGEFSIPVAVGEDTEYARIITARKVRTFAPASYAWSAVDIGTD